MCRREPKECPRVSKRAPNIQKSSFKDLPEKPVLAWEREARLNVRNFKACWRMSERALTYIKTDQNKPDQTRLDNTLTVQYNTAPVKHNATMQHNTASMQNNTTTV